jgi:nitroimidazol reductase NimA-like FMN-containing flavoprotein (pyridoxamine 5'-phosphate oxidase superfamily)
MMGSKKIIDNQQQIEEILSKAKFLRLAFSDANSPHIIPMAFGYKDNSIYLHSSKKGEKIDILRKNPKVCFEADIDADIIVTDDICTYDVRYRSVIGYGQAKFLEDYNEKVEGLTVMSEHYEKKGPFEFGEEKVNRLLVIKVEIEKMTGKESGF